MLPAQTKGGRPVKTPVPPRSWRERSSVAAQLKPSRGENIAFGNPEIAIAQPYFRGSAGREYDISPDGERFLMIKETDATTDESRELILVQNWLEELKRLVPTE